MAGKRIGILALQGAFLEHEKALEKCGADSVQVRTPQEITRIDGLIIPGGESTTIGRLIQEFKLEETLLEKAREGMPMWGTCAGMILLAREIADSDQFRLGLMDMRVKRNAFGRQVDSFESDLQVEGVGNTRGVFIRAPFAEKVWGEARVLAEYQGKAVAVQQGPLLTTAFHPELTEELDIHQYFLSLV